MRTWIKDPVATWTGNELQAPKGVIVEDSTIIELVIDEPASTWDIIHEASDCVLIPGLINCHHHFFQTLTRALPVALNKELFDWLTALYPIWANLTEEAIAASTRTALAELLLSGCTTTSDHHYVFPVGCRQAIDIQAEVAGAMGIRAILTRGSMSLGKSAGGLPPDEVVQDAETILRDSERLIDKYHDSSDGALLQIALAPCSPFSVTTELMRDSAQLARSKGVLLHTHLAETEDENSFCLEMFGRRPLDHLTEVGWLQDDTWLAHGIHFTQDEITRLGDANVAISHCPSSNMILSSGICPVNDLAQAGCSIGLGVDGSASNDCSNLMQEVRQAFLIQRLRYGSANFSHENALHLATAGGAELFHRRDIGQIAVGLKADLALFNLNELRFAGTGNPIAAIVLCGAHQADAVMVNGEWRVKSGELVNADIEQIRAEQKLAALTLLT